MDWPLIFDIMARVWRSGITIVTQPDGSRLSGKFIHGFSMTGIFSHSWYELHTGESMTFPAQTILNSLRWRSCCIGIKYILQSVFAVSVYTKYAVPCYCTLVRCIKRWYEYLALMFINYWRCIIYFLSPSQLCLLLGFPCLHNLIFTCMSLMFFFFSGSLKSAYALHQVSYLWYTATCKLGSWCCSSRSCALS